MKNITALTVLVIIILTLSLSHTAHCQEEDSERNYGFSFGTQFGFIHGQSLEYVYSNPGQTASDILSELVWEVKPVFYYGIKLDFGRINPMKATGFFASASFKTGVPADTGIMEDRDWMSVENSDLTHFSSHTNKTREFFSLDAAVGASIPVRTYFYLKPFLSGSWTRFSFTARDGYWKYPSGTGSFEGEEVCNYKQDWFLLAAGIFIGTNILSPFSLDISFQISPLTYCQAVDEHIKRNETYLDYTGIGLYLEPGGRFSYSVQRIEFSLEAAWRFIGKTKGQSYISYGDFTLRNGTAGAGLSFIDTRLLVKLHF
jgi:outer membrane protease